MQITLTFGPQGTPFTPNPAPTSAPAKQRGKAWYRGDCHLHTVYSDGRRTPQELVADARAAGPGLHGVDRPQHVQFDIAVGR